MIYDILIIGSGPAGLTASIYASRAKKKVIIIENHSIGGLIQNAPKIENYPGFEQISGTQLADKFVNQAMNLNVQFEYDDIKTIQQDKDLFLLDGEYGTYYTKTIIFATGSKHRKLGLPNEDKLTGHGVSYCAVCDGPFYKGQDAIIIGGGNSALQEAVLLASYCPKVTLIQNLDYLTGEQASIDQLKEIKNIEVLYNKKVTKLQGNNQLENIEIEDQKTNEKTTIVTTNIFVAIGQVANNEIAKEFCELDHNGFIITDELCQTKTKGIFCAGDCRKKQIRQISTAISDGTVAAIQAIDYLNTNKI